MSTWAGDSLLDLVQKGVLDHEDLLAIRAAIGGGNPVEALLVAPSSDIITAVQRLNQELFERRDASVQEAFTAWQRQLAQYKFTTFPSGARNSIGRPVNANDVIRFGDVVKISHNAKVSPVSHRGRIGLAIPGQRWGANKVTVWFTGNEEIRVPVEDLVALTRTKGPKEFEK